MDILYLLDRLEEVITSGTRVPLANRTLVDEQECLDILDQIRVAIPDEIKQARRLASERDSLIIEAEERASRILKEAEEQAVSRISDHALIRAAEARAAEIEEQAYRLAEQTRRDADDYAYQVLLRLQKRLERVVGEVERGLAELAAPRADEDEALPRSAIDRQRAAGL